MFQRSRNTIAKSHLAPIMVAALALILSACGQTRVVYHQHGGEAVAGQAYPYDASGRQHALDEAEITSSLGAVLTQ